MMARVARPPPQPLQRLTSSATSGRPGAPRRQPRPRHRAPGRGGEAARFAPKIMPKFAKKSRCARIFTGFRKQQHGDKAGHLIKVQVNWPGTVIDTNRRRYSTDQNRAQRDFLAKICKNDGKSCSTTPSTAPTAYQLRYLWAPPPPHPHPRPHPPLPPGAPRHRAA